MALERNSYVYQEPIEDTEPRPAMGFYVSAESLKQLSDAYDSAVKSGQEALLIAEVEVETSIGTHGTRWSRGNEICAGIVGNEVIFDKKIPLGEKKVK